MQIRLASGDFIEAVTLQGGASTSSSPSAVVEKNYSFRLIKDGAGVTIAETRTLIDVTERQEWIYDATGAYIGVDAWVTV